MKKIFSYIAVAISIGLYSCEQDDLLDPKLNTDLTQASTFADSAKTMDFLFGVYSDIGYTFSYRRYGNIWAGTAEAGDEAMGRLNGPSQPFVIIHRGTLNSSATGPYDNAWNTAWTNIRRANVFLSNVDKAPISMGLNKQVKAEARFLRAWYYAILLKNFGGIPILGDKVFEPTDDLSTPRNTYAECVDYITSELDAAAQDLPVSHIAQNYGRITKGACLGLKSRVLLYAASPFFNGGGNTENAALKELIGYPTYDVERWRKAAQAAKDVIDLGVYALFEDNETAPGYGFSRVFLTRVNNEYVLPGMQAPGKNMEQSLLPPSRGNTNPQSVPTHNLVEAFGMRNGKPITDPASEFDPENPYANRDPRFNYTIIHNGTMWFRSNSNSKEPIYTYAGAPQDGYGVVAWSTGYYWRKMMDENTASNAGPNTERVLPLIRYAEILMNYAEASNELGDIQIAYDQLKLIRRRAGILPGEDEMYGLKPDMTKEEMRAVIQNERQVEFAFEDQRFWDVRRWKIAKETQTATMYAMKITRVSTNPLKYTYEKVPTNVNSVHVFLDANYLFPIMQTEISKNQALLQNPGY